MKMRAAENLRVVDEKRNILNTNLHSFASIDQKRAMAVAVCRVHDAWRRMSCLLLCLLLICYETRSNIRVYIHLFSIYSATCRYTTIYVLRTQMATKLSGVREEQMQFILFNTIISMFSSISHCCISICSLAFIFALYLCIVVVAVHFRTFTIFYHYHKLKHEISI